MIRIYHARRARSARIIWLLEELGIPYELERVEFSPENLNSPKYLALHPLGQVPVIEDGDVTLFESGAIIEYLLEQYAAGRLAPAPGTNDRPLYLQWFHFGEASLARHIGEVVRNRFTKPEPERVLAIVDEARQRFRDALAVVDRALEGREFIIGSSLTAADIMLAYGIVMARITKELPAEFQNVAAYLERLQTRPSYQPAWA